MADRELTALLAHLKSSAGRLSYAETNALLSRAKLLLLQLNALTPAPGTPAAHLALARDTFEQGALASIRARNPDAFTRYVAQLRPFYELLPRGGGAGEEEDGGGQQGERNKVTGLYLLLLLTQGLYGEFHSELEALAAAGGGDAEADRYLGYPIRLERWLMEGSYDRVWKAMKKGEVPCEEFGVFSEVRSLFSLALPPSTCLHPHTDTTLLKE
jgi:26S proteasome regulatory subunit N12